MIRLWYEILEFSKYKIKKIIECFSENITASTAAKILKLNRKTINSYYNEFRERILEHLLRGQEKELGKIELDEVTLEYAELEANEVVVLQGKHRFLGF